MNLDVSRYIRKYIRDNFPMYYKGMDKKEYTSLISFIANDSVFKKYDVMSVENGMADKRINELIESYAQLNLTSIWSNFESFCQYIKRIVESTDKNIVNELNSETYNDIIKEIALNVSKKNDYNYNVFMDGSYDRQFISAFDGHYDRIKRDCYFYVQDIISKSDIKFKYDKSTFEYLSDKIMVFMIREYKIDNIMDGVFDEIIVNEFKKEIANMMNMVREHIISVLNKLDIFILINISVDEIVKGIIDTSIEMGNLSPYRIITGKLDEYIMNYAMMISRDNDPNRAKRHVAEKTLHSCRYEIPETILMYMAEDIYVKFMEYGYTIKDIADGKYDNVISCMVEKKSLEYLSKPQAEKSERKKEGKPSKRVKYRPIKRRMAKTVVVVLLVATLVLSPIFGPKVANKINEIGNKIKISWQYSKFDATVTYNPVSSKMADGRYSDVHTKYSDFYVQNLREALEDYKEYSQYGEEYGYLGIYEMYKHAKADDLAIMDWALRELPQCRGYKDSGLEISESCFLEFVYNRLVEMGCLEIGQDMYFNAVKTYKQAKADASFTDKTPIECITDSDVKSRIREMLQMYDFYCAHKYEELYKIYKDANIIEEHQEKRKESFKERNRDLFSRALSSRRGK